MIPTEKIQQKIAANQQAILDLAGRTDKPALNRIKQAEQSTAALTKMLPPEPPEPTIEELAAAIVEQEAQEIELQKTVEKLREADPRIDTATKTETP